MLPCEIEPVPGQGQSTCSSWVRLIFPDENGFDQFLTTAAGYSNAFTDNAFLLQVHHALGKAIHECLKVVPA